MRRLTFEYRIYPNRKQVVRLQKSLFLAQRMYNRLLELAISTYENDGKRLSKFDMCNEVKLIKDKEPEYKSAYSQVLQNCADRLSKAFDNFFRRVKENKEGKRQKPGFPRFKKSMKSVTYPQDGFKLSADKRSVYISKVGNVRIQLHRPIVGQIKTLTIVQRRSGKWFVLFSCMVDNDDETYQLSPKDMEVGIDVGVRHFVTTSYGDHIDRPTMTKYEKRKHRRLQRNIDRKPKGSHNREKARIQFARYSEWESDCRHDFLHKTSREFVNCYGTIAVEALDLKQMILISPCPDDINSAAWGSLIRMMEYKAESAGTQVLFVDRYDPTSQICSGCHEHGKIGRRETVFNCNKCGLSMDRDTNAARNILRIAKSRAGHARSDARGEGASTSCITEMRVPSLSQELYAGAWTLAESSIV